MPIIIYDSSAVDITDTLRLLLAFARVVWMLCPGVLLDEFRFKTNHQTKLGIPDRMMGATLDIGDDDVVSASSGTAVWRLLLEFTQMRRHPGGAHRQANYADVSKNTPPCERDYWATKM